MLKISRINLCSKSFAVYNLLKRCNKFRECSKRTLKIIYALFTLLAGEWLELGTLFLVVGAIGKLLSVWLEVVPNIKYRSLVTSVSADVI